MISDEEYRARIKAFADATSVTMAEFGETLKRNAEILAAGSRSMSELAAALEINGEGQNGAQGQ